MSAQAWSLAVRGEIAFIRLDDGKSNGYTVEGLARLGEFLDHAQTGARAVVLQGRPGCFSGGFDLKTIGAGGDRLDALLAVGARTFARLLTYPLPVVAACSGHALAAGSLMLLAADVRVGADSNCKIGLHEVAIGSPLPNFLIALARYRLPTAGLEAVLRGEVLDASKARVYGYLDVVVGADQVDQRAAEEAQRLMRLRRGAFAGAKVALRGPIADEMLAQLEADVRMLNPRHARGDKGREFVSSQGRRDV